jgi:hypothetical protein
VLQTFENLTNTNTILTVGTVIQYNIRCIVHVIFTCSNVPSMMNINVPNIAFPPTFNPVNQAHREMEEEYSLD